MAAADRLSRRWCFQRVAFGWHRWETAVAPARRAIPGPSIWLSSGSAIRRRPYYRLDWMAISRPAGRLSLELHISFAAASAPAPVLGADLHTLSLPTPGSFTEHPRPASGGAATESLHGGGVL